jgi:hypothetical protein
LVWRIRNKISQIIKDYFYLQFFLLIILWPQFIQSMEGIQIGKILEILSSGR